MSGSHLTLERENALLCAVVDRVGARVAECDAAALVAERLRVAFESGGSESEVFAALADANREVVALSAAAARGEVDRGWWGMGATADVVYFASSKAHIAHVGDGSVFRWNDGSLDELTTPDTLANDDRRARPDLTDADLAQLPAGVVVRAIGMKDDIAIAHREVPTSPGELWLLCSGSFRARVSDGQIRSLLSRRKATSELIADLLAAAETSSIENGDDVTLVLHAVESPGLR